jgi:UDP-3-O-[3-hydroxymyristoyl] glucosamine N-acyltransferase
MPNPNSNYSLSDLSVRFGLELRGDGSCQIDGVGTLASAGPSEITFYANMAYREDLATTGAGAVILKAGDAEKCPGNCLVAADPYLAYARLAAIFDPRPAAPEGIHDSAVVSPTAKLGENISIGPHAVIGDACEIGNACTIGPGAVLYDKCRLGSGCHVHANVTLGYGVRLGQRVIVHPGAVIGADGFGIAFATDHWEKVPQLGGVVIGDDCEIGCNTTIDRGAIGDTVLEEDVRIDNLCQIGHNVQIGAHTAIAGLSGVAGSTKVGKYCMIAGGSGFSGHLEIADKTSLASDSRAYRSIRESGTTWSAQLPAQPIRDWQRNLSRLRKLDELARRVRELEKQLEKSSKNE